MLPFISDDFRCICIELPGFGKSEPIQGLAESGVAGMGKVASAIWAELDNRNLKEVWLAGHSLGGYVLLAMLEQAPERISGMVLFHSSPFEDTPERKQVREKVIGLVKQHGADPFLATFADGLFRQRVEAWEFFREKSSEVRSEAVATYAAIMRDRADRSALLRNAGRPLLIIAGRYDAIITPDVSERIAALNPAFLLSYLEKSAHTGMLEEPETSARLLNAFIIEE